MRSCRLFPSIILLCLLAGGILPETRAQTLPVTVRGQVTDTDRQLVLYPATVRNKKTNVRVFTDNGGYYRIPASKGDSILISFLGYLPQTFVVDNSVGEEVRDIRLALQERFLPRVEVSGKWNQYQLDSIARYEDYRPFLETKNRTLVDTEKKTQGGFGLTFSPFTRYSRKQKDLRKFKELYAKNEIQSYIDYRYSKTFVQRVTGFTGDSLLKFMYKYQPPYDMLRGMNNETLIFWISERAKQWRKDPNVTLKPED